MKNQPTDLHHVTFQRQCALQKLFTKIYTYEGRLNWIKNIPGKRWTVDDERFFCNEEKFDLGGFHCHQNYWHHLSNDKRVLYFCHVGDVCFMIQSCFACNAPSPLVLVDEKKFYHGF